MLLFREPPTALGQRHSAEVCAEVDLLLLDKDLGELQQKATSGQRTIGQMIRLTLGHYLAEMRDRCDADNGQDHAQHDMLTEGSSIITLMLLLPLSWMAELESIAAPGDTTEGILIRRVVYSALIGCQAGEGRWIVKAAIDESVPAPVLTAARYERFASRGDADFADNLLSVLRFQFGGHEERPEGAEGGGR